MKKILSLILACVLVLCSVPSASAMYSEEILFRDIPWGTTYPEAMKMMKESGIFLSKPKNIKDDTYYFSAYTKNVKVAGVNGFELTMYFVLDKVGGDIENGRLYRAVYEYKETGPKAASIPDKVTHIGDTLEAIYGKTEKSNKDERNLWGDYFHLGRDEYYKTGKNGTHVEAVYSLTSKNNGGKTYDITEERVDIRYEWNGLDSLIENHKKTIDRMEKQELLKESDGL